jgi:hypothetical protein
LNMDPSYLQFIASLMNDDGFEPPGSRRPSLGSYPLSGMEHQGSRNNSMDECTSDLVLFASLLYHVML